MGCSAHGLDTSQCGAGLRELGRLLETPALAIGLVEEHVRLRHEFECLLSSGERISLAMRKAEVLLAYLALAPGIRHPRERLTNLLWSNRSEEQARNSLRQALSAIKKSLASSPTGALAGRPIRRGGR